MDLGPSNGQTDQNMKETLGITRWMGKGRTNGATGRSTMANGPTIKEMAKD